MSCQTLVDCIPAITGIVLGLVIPAMRPYVNGVLSKHYHARGGLLVKQYTNDSMYLLSLMSANAAPFVAYSSILQVAVRQGEFLAAVIGYFVLLATTLGLTIPLPFRVSPTTFYNERRYLPVRFMGPAIAVAALLVTLWISK